jgi:thiamine biosynthesis lipoprotein
MSWGEFRAMGTDVRVFPAEEQLVEQVAKVFETSEQAFSRFRPDSLLDRLNTQTEDTIDLAGDLLEILSFCERMRRATGGLVDVAVGGAVRAWGYDRTFEEVSDRLLAPVLLEHPAWWIEADRLHRAPGVLFDLGGVAKGWTVDRAIETTAAEVVNAGGDLRSRRPDTLVEIMDPWEQTAATVRLGVGALATSSTTRRRWQVGQEEAHHLIDPRTLAPAHTPVLSASALALTAAEAEVAAKTVLLMGEDGLNWADQTDWVGGAVIVWHDGAVYSTSEVEVL